MCYFPTFLILVNIFVYFDDLIILTICKQDCDYTRDELGKSFKMKDLGLLHIFLSIEFMQKMKSIMITQKKIHGRYSQNLF